MAYRFQVAGLWLIFRGVIHTSVGESPRRCLLVLIKFHHLSLFDGPSRRRVVRDTALWSTFRRVVPWRRTTLAESRLCGLALDKLFRVVFLCRTSWCGAVTTLVACIEWLCFYTQISAFYENMV
jgi:hypothetical protein